MPDDPDGYRQRGLCHKYERDLDAYYRAGGFVYFDKFYPLAGQISQSGFTTSTSAFLFVAWGIDGGAPSKSFKAIVLPVKRSKIAPTTVQLDYTARHTSEATTRFLYVILLMGLGITLGQEIVYVRDFLDGGDYFRMNTVFKFSLQAWLRTSNRLQPEFSGILSSAGSGDASSPVRLLYLTSASRDTDVWPRRFAASDK